MRVLAWFLISAVDVGVEDLSEDLAKHTIDQQVDGRVDHKENVGDKAKNNDPDGKPAKVRVSTDVDLFNDSNFMHVEENSEKITKDKG